MKIKNNIILWGNFYGFTIMGLINIFFGLMLPYFRNTYNLSYEQGGLLLAFLAAGSLVFGFVSGIVGDFIGMKKILISGHLLYSLGLIIIFLSNTSELLFIGIFITGAGWGSCNTSINMSVNEYTNGNGKHMSLLHMYFGLGAFLIPIISNILVNQGLFWKNIILILVFLELISVIFAFNMEISHKKILKNKNRKQIKNNVFADIRLYIPMMVLFFYVGAESSINGWIVTYLMDGLNFSDFFSQSIISFFWLAMIFGRLLNSVISEKIKIKNIVLASSIGALIMILLFVRVTSPVLIIITILFLAIFCSGVYPLTIADANKIVNGSSSALALVTLGGGIGSMVIPYISGKVAEEFGINGAMKVILISIVILNVFAVLNKKEYKRTGDINAQKVV